MIAGTGPNEPERFRLVCQVDYTRNLLHRSRAYDLASLMTPISKDLRRRVVEAHLAGKGTYAQIAELSGVGEASVSRWLRLHRERAGDLTPEPHAGGMPALVPRSEYGVLRKLVAEKPDRTVVEVRDEWQRRFGVNLSRSAMQRARLNAGLTWKKNGSERPSRIVRKSRNAATPSSR